MRFKIHDIALVGLFSALAFAGGYLFLAIPNVEIITALIFLSGFFLGPKQGLLVGLIAQTLYSLLNPYGVSPPPLFVAQVLHRMLLGYVGGRFRDVIDEETTYWKAGIALGLAGLFLTWLYDIATDLSFFLISGFTFEQMKTTFLLGAPFYLIHGLVNLGIFAFILPLVIRGMRRGKILKSAEA